ncbi:glycoside hydrolase [Vararia minispora EC-137]|uniref:Glycoside hydrolase n=1 Tax=Vararia minispora EC-137 TaxID=1314806 RepID=A0ACB8QWD6_9AGAM|nr:glycoside hydrolase [Vararia minispora EC-137]
MVALELGTVVLLLAWVQAATITSNTMQPVRGIGASGAWWVNDLALFPAEVRQQVSDMLLNQTSDDGIGLTDYRYNLGGGGVGVKEWDRVHETPYLSDREYDWEADEAGTFFLREAARHGVPYITLFVNSAPPAFTTNGKSCGGNLKIDRILAFAQYIADVISYWKSEGVQITHVSPLNEPDNAFWACWQEGMAVYPIAQRGKVMLAVAKALEDAGLNTKVIGDESSMIWEVYGEAPLWLDREVGAVLDGIATHQYAFVNGRIRRNMVDLTKRLSGGTPGWATEVCCYKPSRESYANDPLSGISYGPYYDPTMVSGLRMAKFIFEALGEAGEEHWDWWLALSPQLGSCEPAEDPYCAEEIQHDGWDDGLIYYDPYYQDTKFYGLHLTKRYWVLRHFTKAAPAGAVVREVLMASKGPETKWRVIAFDYPERGTLYSIVAMNAQDTWSSLHLQGDDKFVFTTPKKVYCTHAEENWAEVDAVSLAADSSVDLHAPGLSIVTLFF